MHLGPTVERVDPPPKAGRHPDPLLLDRRAGDETGISDMVIHDERFKYRQLLFTTAELLAEVFHGVLQFTQADFQIFIVGRTAHGGQLLEIELLGIEVCLLGQTFTEGIEAPQLPLHGAHLSRQHGKLFTGFVGPLRGFLLLGHGQRQFQRVHFLLPALPEPAAPQGQQGENDTADPGQTLFGYVQLASLLAVEDQGNAHRNLSARSGTVQRLHGK